jgi:hypothetical protein
MRKLQAIFLVLALGGCAPFGVHRPAQVLAEDETEIGLSIDLVSFVARVREAERSPDRLDEWLLMPALQLRRGLGSRAEVDLSLLPLGLRAGARYQVYDGERVGSVAETGLSVMMALADSSKPTSDWQVLLLPDAAVSTGYSPSERSQVYLAARYLWLRGKIAGAGFTHTPALTLGGTFEPGSWAVDAEGTMLWSPSSGDIALVPGAGLTLEP